ncbi:isopenicillin-N epimerase [Chitinivorax tropicus]|uniref:Isopenicillin-N epimerase n=1 Tax=Chitinivorax tropicus TaxID=714531 RepID=A0A840MRY7_9PROT|nr:isopenicillin-N epimerase [Chitinivorax tropicus]
MIEKQKHYMDLLEYEPVDFSIRKWFPLYHANKEALAEFIGAKPHDIYLVPNATVGVNHVLHNTKDTNKTWLTTNHAYGACQHALQRIGGAKGNEIVKVTVPFPLQSEDDILDAIESGITPDTTLALIDYISSGSAIIFPIKKIIERLHARGVKVLVDAAHAPGMVDLNVDALDADYLVANCHKWMCCPKGSAFVYVNPRHQAEFHPVLYSFFNDWDVDNARHWSNQFIWEGTRDYSAYLCIKDTIEYMATLVPGGWPEIMARNRALAIQGAKLIADKLGVSLPVPESMLGSIVTIPLWDDKVPTKCFHYYSDLKNKLYDTYQIEVPCMLFPKAPTQHMRVSAQLYNSLAQYEYLAECLLEIRRGM